MTKSMKIKYASPTIKKIGDFQNVTQHASGGGKLDAAFGANTPVSALTFS